MDVLDKLMYLARLRGRIDVCCRLGGGFHLGHGTEPETARLHWVLSGSGWLRVGDGPAVALHTGDAVLLPYDTPHSIADSLEGLRQPPGRPQLSERGVFTIKDCGGNSLQLLCGCYHYTRHAALWLGMPAYLLLPLPEMRQVALTMLEEADGARYGSGTVVNALSQVMLVAVLRRYRQQSSDPSFLSQLADPRLNAVLQAVLVAPQEDWPVDRMAEVARLSRAQLMRLFKSVVGVSPHRFVLSIRLQQAAVQLSDSADTVLRIALDNGFVSESHFNRAFKQYFGQTPKQYRVTVGRAT
ncbi:AraC family transcriptional regulator [Eikenella sp. S3360]|uniref:AraC family transcriptional regulator n=1 Tax=Eikenella glucosivorans TaxID=2766967 RepID=A0ABS0NAL1_9NEIS|nr:AraC family transcriptional regulator [Eikenella glucosivorans]MBH5329363.1 AraC family transcriptional regulator [Eikenella glucosivorans]